MISVADIQLILNPVLLGLSLSMVDTNPLTDCPPPPHPPACNCGTRLCEPVTGDCICPPRTLQPECTQCEPLTFGCHPVVGCEVCNCSQSGVASPDVNCDTTSGQCRYVEYCMTAY